MSEIAQMCFVRKTMLVIRTKLNSKRMSVWFHSLSNRILSKWLALFVDLAIVGFSFLMTTLLRFNLEFSYPEPDLFKFHLVFLLVVKAFFILIYKSYTGVIRHTSMEDALVILYTQFSSLLVLVLPHVLISSSWETYLHIPLSILLIEFFVALFALVFTRILIKSTYESLINTQNQGNPVIIYGAGFLGKKVKEALTGGGASHSKVLGFVDDDRQLINMSMAGTRVYSWEQAYRKFVENPIRNQAKPTIIFAIQRISAKKKNEIIASLVDQGMKVKVPPPVGTWMDGKLKAQEIKDVRIEDLLNREPIKIANQKISGSLRNKIVLITGAAGSIGSELVRQIISYQPAKIILLDQAESALYDLETELIRLKKDLEHQPTFQIEIADVANRAQMEPIFSLYQPDFVFHAAAYKHVPLMEKSPCNAVRVNVLGTQVVADLSSIFRVEKFILVSTDKAVNPTNVMGATKRLAEMYVHGLNKHHANHTRFIITRFGNVLGSNGSVIPLFRRQIANGGPITVTHPDIIRYFMTIPEACQLVLEASTMGRGGEIYVFDMGEPVKIVDLAKRMIRLSGLELGQDINIEFTGLRPGEKLYEELLSDSENTIPTHHEKIMIARIKAGDYDTLREKLLDIQQDLFGPSQILVGHLKALVPEFISKNSEFEQLDSEALIQDL